jgi:uncharacterized protein YjcR
MGLKKGRERQRAQDWYIENLDATFSEIAEKFGVTPKTIGDWATKDDWEGKRRDYHASPVRIQHMLQQEIISVASGNDPKLNADTISKLMAAYDKLQKKADPTIVHKILKDLDNFISQADPDFAQLCTPYHKQFLQHRIELES